jgi:hypothetical protein
MRGDEETMRSLTTLFGIVLLAAVPGLAAAAIYKWVDENGQVQYTETPPPGGVESSEIKPPPEPADQKGTIEREERLEKALDERRESRDAAAKQAAEDAEYEKQKGERCEAAKRRLEQAERPLTNFVDADGTQRRATEEERQEQIKQSQEQVKKFCE